MVTRLSVGIVGARGYLGAELIRLIDRHPVFELSFVSSRELAGQVVSAHCPEVQVDLAYAALTAGAVAASGVDIIVLAMPNGKSRPYVAAIEAAAPDTCVIDLSADHRFDDGWYYGLPELTRGRYRGRTRISNPGCYSTAIQLTVAPMRPWLVGPVQCFGISGYSGAGTTPSEKNDPEVLRNNVLPYTLTDHVHERETSRQLDHPIEFFPHVAPHFRGLAVTTNMHLGSACSIEEIRRRYRAAYGNEALIRLYDDPPWVSRVANTPYADLGGFTLSPDKKRLVAVATLDNLLKGAASQAVQNLNLAFDLPETLGIV